MYQSVLHLELQKYCHVYCSIIMCLIQIVASVNVNQLIYMEFVRNGLYLTSHHFQLLAISGASTKDLLFCNSVGFV